MQYSGLNRKYMYWQKSRRQFSPFGIHTSHFKIIDFVLDPEVGVRFPTFVQNCGYSNVYGYADWEL